MKYKWKGEGIEEVIGYKVFVFQGMESWDFLGGDVFLGNDVFGYLLWMFVVLNEQEILKQYLYFYSRCLC